MNHFYLIILEFLIKKQKYLYLKSNNSIPSTTECSVFRDATNVYICVDFEDIVLLAL